MTHVWRLLRSLRTVLRALRRRTLGAGGACLVVLASLNRAAFSGAVESYVSWLGASAQRGDPDAQFLLALNRAQETGVPENLASAVAWRRELGGQGDPRGLAVVGAMYMVGAGVGRDDAAAVRLLSEAAGQLNLGRAYARGRGVAVDLVEAYAWLDLAAAAGSPEASRERDALASRMKPEAVTRAQGLARDRAPKMP